ncbi:MAG: RHS repeat-associated core domain-containing protein [Clostridiales bacterium]|jgi:RHS repeat-associated protein|nr:RHS repeat-associated core domain-containing protein [Clostridiales bacterium]
MIRKYFFHTDLRRENAKLRLIAAAVAVLLLFASIPAGAISYASKNWFFNGGETESFSEESYAQSVAVVGEDESKRGYDEKVFLLEDGTYLKQVYAEDVHYYDIYADSFKEIDNTLKEKGEFYVNSDNSFKVGLSKDASGGGLVTVSEHGVTLSMSPLSDGESLEALGAKKPSAVGGLKTLSAIAVDLNEKFEWAANIEKNNNVKFKNALAKISLFDSLEKTSAKADYENIYPGVNFEYSLSGRSLKENIVVAERQADYNYAFKINAGNASLALEDSGGVAVYDIAGNKAFTIPKGYMYDAAGNRSDNVVYQLEKRGEEYILVVKADGWWINSRDRVFPVTIDPTIRAEASYTYKNYWHSVDTRYEYDKLKVETNTQGINSTEYAMIRFDDGVFAGISAEQIISATMTLKAKTYSYQKWSLFGGGWSNYSSTSAFTVYNNYYTSNYWNSLSDIASYVNQSSLSVSAAFLDNNNAKNTFTVTDYAKLAASGQNYGMVLTTPDASSTIKHIAYYAENDGSVGLTDLPILNIQLSVPLTPDSYQTSDDAAAVQSPLDLTAAAYAGEDSFDIEAWKVSLIASDIEYGGGKLPLSISRVYGRGTAIGMGTDWRLNLSQTITQSGNNYIYTAADGKTYTIENLLNTAAGLSLTVGQTGYVLEDFNKNQLIFDENGRLTEINSGYFDANGDAYFKLSIAYSGDKITEVTDSLGRTVYLSYTSGLLDGITDESGNVIASYSYSSGRLIAKTVLGGAACQYEYDGQGRLTKAIDSNLRYTAYSYPSPTATQKSVIITEGKDGEVLTIKTVSVLCYSQTVKEFENIDPGNPNAALALVNNIYDTKEVKIEENDEAIIYKYRKRSTETDYALVSVNKIDATFSQSYSLKPIVATTLTQVGEINAQEAYYVTRDYENESAIYTNYFSGGSLMIDYGTYVKGYTDESYVPDKGGTQSSLLYGGLTKDFYTKNLTLNSEGGQNEYYFTFWGKTLGGYLIISCEINYGSFTETRAYAFQPVLSYNFSMGAIKFPIKNGQAPQSVAIKATFFANSTNQSQDGGIAQIDCFTVSIISLKQRVGELNVYESISNANPLIRKQYYIAADGQITYDAYHYANAENKKLIEIRGADNALKYKYYYNWRNSIEYEVNYRNGASYTVGYKYDGKGLLVSKIRYAKNTVINYTTGIAEAGAVFLEETYGYDDFGRLISYVDIDGIETNYVLDEKNRVVAVQYDDGTSRLTTYANDYGSIAKTKTGDIGNTYLYNSSGQLTEVYHNGFVTSLEYDSDKRLSSVAADGNVLIAYYYDSEGRVVKELYGNNQEVNYEYVGETTVKIYFGTTLRYTIEYNNDGSVKKITDAENSTTTSYSETYNDNGAYTYSMTGSSGKASHSEQVNPAGAITQSVDTIQGTASRTTSYNYDSRGGLTSTAGAQGTYTYIYDNFGRIVGGSINGFSQSAALNGGQISGFTYLYNGAVIGAYGYTYDAVGRLISVSENGVLKIAYVYDVYGRLIREDNAYTGETVLYGYDAGGNIRKKDFYAYTNAATTGGPTLKEVVYKYDGAWADQLTAYLVYYKNSDGETYRYEGSESFVITYDGAGNPATYRGNALTWTMGGRLASYGGTSYKYDLNGMRTEKKIGQNVAKYFWDGDRLFAENANGTYIWYYYNVNGIQGMEYGGIMYYYIKNALGDVSGIVDANGAIVARYTYDAWGVATVYDANGNIATSGIGCDNRIRYRGYYFDGDTGLYYLQSRYYDPNTGRFISADEAGIIYLSVGLVGSANLYAYCNNNPIANCDPTGYWSFNLESIIKILQFIRDEINRVIFPMAIVAAGTVLNLAIGEISWQNVQDDLNNFDWNNTDPNAVLNSTAFSYYKGTFVMRHYFEGFATSAQLFNTIFLNNAENSEQRADIKTLNHEWGHSVQNRILGNGGYILFIGIPSVIGFALIPANATEADYYSLPWERTADYFGGVDRGDYYEGSLSKAKAYFALAYLFSVIWG